MEKNIFALEEVLEKTGVSEKNFKAWKKLKLINPEGVTDGNIPLFTKVTLEKIRQIKNLSDLGYQLNDIQKIIKKVGLPQGEENGKKSAKLNEFLTVGGLAEQVGVSPRTIKHWEDKGIIEPDMRSEGGFRLYSEIYIYLCTLIKDLQLFGYSLEEIKEISNLFRDFLTIENNLVFFKKEETTIKLNQMLSKIQILFDKIALFKEGIQRWEDLLKKKKKEILGLRNQLIKKPEKIKEKKDE
ncbi:MAG: MerR family transcriptional regulator [Candidatus Aminicenantes bacterium]|nr:MerR family transcriptional regulator [Candidatus Aminicenantes bacterium]